MADPTSYLSLAEAYTQVHEKWKISDLFTGDNETRRTTRRALAGQGGGSGTKDAGYDPKTGTTTVRGTKPGESAGNRVVAPRGGRAGTMVKGDPSSWIAMPSSSTQSQAAMRRYNQVKKGNEAENKRYHSQFGAFGDPKAVVDKSKTKTTTPSPAPRPSGGSSGGSSPSPRPSGGSSAPRPSGGSSAAARPASRPSAPTRPAAPPKIRDYGSADKNMQAWAKANPKLAAKVKPGQSGYKAISSMSKPSPAKAAASPKPSTPPPNPAKGPAIKAPVSKAPMSRPAPAAKPAKSSMAAALAKPIARYNPSK